MCAAHLLCGFHDLCASLCASKPQGAPLYLVLTGPFAWLFRLFSLCWLPSLPLLPLRFTSLRSSTVSPFIVGAVMVVACSPNMAPEQSEAGWEKNWVASKAPGKEFGKFAWSAGQYVNDAEEDKGESFEP